MKINVIPDLIGDPYKKEPGSRVKHGMTSGFTLIELLIVIAIISALSAISVMTYTGSQKRARDAQRRSDLKQYQMAVEAFAVRNGGYPSCPGNSGAILGTGTGLVCPSEWKLSSCPTDPKTGTAGYNYRYDTGSATGCTEINNPLVTTSKYWLYAKLESSGKYLVYCYSGVNKEVDSITSGLDDCP